MKETTVTILIVLVILLGITGFIYNYFFIDGSSDYEDCVPDPMWGGCI